MAPSSFVMFGLLLAAGCILSSAYKAGTHVIENNEISQGRIMDILNSDRVTTGKGISFQYRVRLLWMIFKTLLETGYENSVAAAKTAFLAKELLDSGDAIEGSAEFIILNAILQNSTIFAKNFANGFSCRIPENKAKYSLLDRELMTLYIADNFGRVSKSNYEEKPDGELLAFTVNSGSALYLMENGNYHEAGDILLGENLITSRKNIGKIEATRENTAANEFEEWFCFPISTFFKVPNQELEL